MARLIYFATILFLTFILSTASNCKKEECVENPKPDCVCTMEYDPVCGCNNVTYGNACSAECMGIYKYTKGPCEKS